MCAGFLQVAAAYSRLRGLLLVRNVPASYALGAALVSAGIAWFVVTGAAHIPGDRGGVEGSQQFRLFLGAAATASALTALATSMAHIRHKGKPSVATGLEALRECTLVQAVVSRLGRDNPPRNHASYQTEGRMSRR